MSHVYFSSLIQFVWKSDLNVFVTVLVNLLCFLQSLVVTIPLRSFVQYEYLRLFKYRRTVLSDTSVSPDTYLLDSFRSKSVTKLLPKSWYFPNYFSLTPTIQFWWSSLITFLFCLAFLQGSPPSCNVYRYFFLQTVYIV